MFALQTPSWHSFQGRSILNGALLMLMVWICLAPQSIEAQELIQLGGPELVLPEIKLPEMPEVPSISVPYESMRPIYPQNLQPKARPAVPVPSTEAPPLVDPNVFWIVSSYQKPQEPGSDPNLGQLQHFWMRPCESPKPVSCQQFRNALLPGLPVCVMVHGSFVNWDSAVQDAEETFRWLKKCNGGQPVQMVFFVWPSDGPYTYIPSIDVQRSGRRAAQNGIYLAHTLSMIPYQSSVSLLGHSHGTRLIAAGLHYAAGGQIHGNRSPIRLSYPQRYRVVFAAAAVDHHWLNPENRYGLALSQMETLLNLRNRSDLALAVYPLLKPFSGAALARSGFTQWDKELQGCLSCKLKEWDVTDLIQEGHVWMRYYNQPQLASRLAPWVFFHDRPIAESTELHTQLPQRERVLKPVVPMWNKGKPAYQLSPVLAR